VRIWPASSRTLVERTSAKSWSSEATQNTGTTPARRSAASIRAALRAQSAL
jgi:hypothetical protein